MSDKQQPLLAGEDNKPLPQMQRPDQLRTICSLSCGLPARAFIGLARDAGITAVLDTRVTREYRGVGFSTAEDDFRFLCELASVEYHVVDSLMPSTEMREEFARTFKDVKEAAKRDPQAWTRYLEQYEKLLQDRRPLRDSNLLQLIYGQHQAIAVVCACRHHDDCHRSYACGLLAGVLPDVTLQVLYPDSTAPKPVSPRRYRLHAFTWAGLVPNAPATRRSGGEP